MAAGSPTGTGARVLVVGLDGADLDVVRPLLDAGRLPSLRALLADGAWGPLRSTVPPMTFPAWTSFATGCNPGRHGLFDLTTRVPGTYRVRFVNGTDRREPTMWGRLSAAGARVCVLGVPATYPAEPVNGYMVCGFDTPIGGGPGRRVASPRDVFEQMRREVGPWPFRGLPQQRIGPRWHARARERLLQTIRQKTAVARWALARERWDCLVCIFGESDAVAHHFWMFADPASPRYRASPHGSAIQQVYEELDRAVEALVDAARPDLVCTVSDHGSGGTGTTVLHLNRWLAAEGLLRFRQDTRAQGAIRGTKTAVLRWMPNRLQLLAFRLRDGWLAERIESLTRLGHIDWRHTLAFSEELNYFPAIWLNCRGRDPEGQVAAEQYEQVREEIAERLRSWKDPRTGRLLLRAVHRREDLYWGPWVDRAPDLVLDFDLEDGYSVAVLPSSGPGPALRSLPREEHLGAKGEGMNGSHRPLGLLAFAGSGVAPGRWRDPPMIWDVTPTLLGWHGWRCSEMDGRGCAAVTVRAEVPAPAAPVPSSPSPYSPGESAEVYARLKAMGYLE